MDVSFDLNGVAFEWDETKYAVNLQKHGVKFEEAAEVFFDPENRFGDASIENEVREFVIGYSVSQRVLFVIFVERGIYTRIISARKATLREREQYEK